MSDDMNKPEDSDLVYRPGPKKPETITFFAHENAMMHKDMDNERSHRTTMFVCIFALLFALTFVVAYTIRMNVFAELIRDMTAALVELAHAKGIPAP